MGDFVHLHVHSHFSLLDGLMDVSEIVDAAKSFGHDAIAITDHGNLYGWFKFWKACKEAEIKPIFGCEVYIAKDHQLRGPEHRKRWHLILLARNEEGFKNLIQLSTISFIDGFYYKPRLDLKLLYKYRKGLICLSGCMAGEVGEAINNGNAVQAKKAVRAYHTIFKDDYYLEIMPHEDLKLYNKRSVGLAYDLDVPMVATCDAHFLRPEDHELHVVLLKIRTKGGFEYHAPDIWLKSKEEALETFRGQITKLTATQAIDNTVRIGEQIEAVDIDCSQKLPHFEVENV